MVFVNQMPREEMQEILRASKMGLWKITAKEGEAPKFYADGVMNELIGTPEDMTPEDRFLFHRAHIHPDDMELFMEYSDKLSRERTEVVYRYLHPVYGEMYVRCSGIRDESVTDQIWLSGFHQDISETVRLEKDGQAEQRLAEQNETLRKRHLLQRNYYRELLNAQSCGLLAYTIPGHRLVHMNTEAMRMYGFLSEEDAQERMGQVVGSLYYPDPSVIPRLKNLQSGDEPVEFQFVIHKGTPKECHAVGKTKVLYMPDGEKIVMTTFLDVSELVMVQQALKKAEEGSRAKTSFLFNMSHDLRTPMNAIIGYADLMETHWGDELTRSYLAKLQEASGYLLSIINNVLEMARIESGKEVLKEEPCDLRRVEETLEVMLDGMVGEKKLTCTSSFSMEHPYVWCDLMKIQEIVLNLLGNAVKYTGDGGTVSFIVDEIPAKKEGCARFRTVVSDTGKGISKEYLPHMFESFTREQNTSECGIGGTGLGLSIAKSLVDLMGGTIGVESELGKGTAITIELEHRIAEEPPKEEKKSCAVSLQEEEKLAGKRVLLAEDNVLNAEIAGTILTDYGILVEAASDGAEAVAMVQQAPKGYYDWILMDIQMPNMDGYTAARRIRALDEPKARIPVIAMTANAFEEDKKAAHEAGMDDYITKPVDVDGMIRTLLKFI